jgi:hypothetical protein
VLQRGQSSVASGSPLHMTTSLIFPLISQLISIKGGWDLPALGCLEGIGPAAATRTVNGVLNLTQKRKFSSTKVDNYRLRSSRFPANISEDVLMSADKDKWIADIQNAVRKERATVES